jgi:hypothetical protein
MTLQSQLQSGYGRYEWILCIEGIGYPVNISDLSQGFQGNVFVTNDFGGNLAATLGCSIVRGLRVTGNISERLDSRQCSVEMGSASFELVDAEEFMLANFSPLRNSSNYSVTELDTDLSYSGTTIRLDDGTNFATGDTAWIGGRECVKLGTKVAIAGTVYDYTSSTRGYLGTPKGRNDPNRGIGTVAGWEQGADVRDYNRFWYGKKMRLYMRNQGATLGQEVLVWQGKLSAVSVVRAGNIWEITGTGDNAQGVLTPVVTIPSLEVIDDAFISPNGSPDSLLPWQAEGRKRYLTVGPQQSTQTAGGAAGIDGSAVIASIYQYRSEPGGTLGALGNIFGTPSGGYTTTPQALDTSADDNIAMRRLLIIGDTEKTNTLAIKQQPAHQANHFIATIDIPVDPLTGDAPDRIYRTKPGDSVRVLLDNFPVGGIDAPDDYRYNRFTVNKQVTRNPIDVLLMFLTTHNHEFFVGDTAAHAHTATAIKFSPSPSWTVNEWAGAALHCIEDSNKGEARVIESNTADTITVGRAFSNAPDAGGGHEYQIRASIYDALPVPWGRSTHLSQSDNSAFEAVRDKYLTSAKLGNFALGAKDSLDLWAMLRKNILEPYRIAVYISRSTGKLTARYVGDAYGDTVLDNYVAITAAKMVDIGSVDYGVAKVLGKINIRTRKAAAVFSDVSYGSAYNSWIGAGANNGVATGQGFDPFVEDGLVQNIAYVPEELQSAFDNKEFETITIDAMFNDESNIEHVIANAHGIMMRQSIPAPTVQIKLTPDTLPDIEICKFINFTLSSPVTPHNPFTLSRGWSGVVGRIIEISIPTTEGEPTVDVTVELLSGMTIGKIAPAAYVTSKGSDGTGDYFVVSSASLSPDDDVLDYSLFAVGDLVQLKSRQGVNKENETIASIDTVNHRIYVNPGTITSAIATGDYLTFQDCSGSNTVNMNLYSAYASTAPALTGGLTVRRYV